VAALFVDAVLAKAAQRLMQRDGWTPQLCAMQAQELDKKGEPGLPLAHPITVDELKKRRPGKYSDSHRSRLHDDITVAIVSFESAAGAAAKRAALTAYLANPQTEVAAAKLASKLFKILDVDGSGSITADEIWMVFGKRLGTAALGGKAVTKQELDDLMTAMDSDRDGDVTFDEFVTWFESASQDGGDAVGGALASILMGTKKRARDGEAVEQAVEGAFGSPRVSQRFDAQLIMVVRELADKSEAELRAEFEGLDTDGNGTLDVDEIGQLVKRVLKTEVMENVVKSIFAELDKDNSGDVDLQEFANYFGV
jgi:Ca2+-binding EF-hand superfamily protein